MTDLTLSAIRGTLDKDMKREATILDGAIRKGVETGGRATQLRVRRVIDSALNVKAKGRAKLSNAIRLNTYRNADGWAWQITSRAGRTGPGGEFEDILESHQQGARIKPQRGTYIFQPFQKSLRRKAKRAKILQDPNVFLTGQPGDDERMVMRRGKRKAKPLGRLVKGSKEPVIPKRVDLSPVLAQAERATDLALRRAFEKAPQ